MFEIVLYYVNIDAGELREFIGGDELMGLFVEMLSYLVQ